MAETPKLTDAVSGKMFLYQQPELLTPEDHGALGLTPSERPFEHVADVRVMPLTMIEFGSAQRHYPIVFASLENPVPLAVVGVIDDVNLFVSDGQWDPLCYVPSYLRCYPFAFAAAENDRIAVVVDRAAASVGVNPRFPFFANGELSEESKTMMRFCGQYETERKRTRAFCDRLKELGLFSAQQANYKPDGAADEQSLASFVSIDAQKLTELGAQTVHELHRSGLLAAMYLQLYSLENWRPLMTRRIRRQGAGAR
jgi:hypothetical protein